MANRLSYFKGLKPCGKLLPANIPGAGLRNIQPASPFA
jgi:hypothetical protein